MVKSTHISFPQEGVELHVSAQDALEQGIKPGDPAVVEVTVRSHTVQEWIAEATERTFQTEDEEGEALGRGPVPTPDAAAEPIGGEDDEDHPRIRWTPSRVGG